jgi:hypothetical protein
VAPLANSELAAAESDDSPPGDSTSLQATDDDEDELPAVLRERLDSRALGAPMANAEERAGARRESGRRNNRAREENETTDPLFSDRERAAGQPPGAPVPDIAFNAPSGPDSDGPPAAVVPDADQMIEEISARVKHP